MALNQSALLELLGRLLSLIDPFGDGDPYQELIDAEATAVIGAGPFERSLERTT